MQYGTLPGSTLGPKLHYVPCSTRLRLYACHHLNGEAAVHCLEHLTDDGDVFLAIRSRQLTSNVGKFAFFQLRFPEDRIRVAKAMFHPSIFLHMVKIDEATGVSISVCCR